MIIRIIAGLGIVCLTGGMKIEKNVSHAKVYFFWGEESAQDRRTIQATMNAPIKLASTNNAAKYPPQDITNTGRRTGFIKRLPIKLAIWN